MSGKDPEATCRNKEGMETLLNSDHWKDGSLGVSQHRSEATGQTTDQASPLFNA